MNRDMVPFLGLNDPFSSLSHAVGCLGLICAFVVLSRMPIEDRRRRIGVLCYPVFGGLQLACSAIYHSQWPGFWRTFFWRLDHVTIWVALAGGFTAIMSVFGRWSPRYLTLVWVTAATGAIVELTPVPALYPWVCPLLYVAMGWLCFPLWLSCARRHGVISPVGLIMLGGISATAGGLIDSFQRPHLWRRVFEAHELMHVLILFGAWSYAPSFFFGLRRRAWAAFDADPVATPA